MAKPKQQSSGRKAPAKKPAKPAPGGAYAVLARKYRPTTFDGLIGQDAMVRTLRNAFETGRIAQAYMLTGVRGVGKTTTARILARALNYEAPGVTGPTIDMPEPGEHCAAIMESRHQDVIEIDAASHTGVDNIREIIDSVRYRPAYARTKVYIVDEVHMLSKPAFNALLKTLEEPPEHVKFVFATTEARKVPVTVLSRCQRFDLRRVDVEQLQAHFATVAKAEGVDVAQDALALIARAAEGSVRDGLSILDQAIAHASGPVTGDHVRAMLGLADRERVFALLETVFGGDARGAIEALKALYDDGAEPAQAIADMAEAVHVVTRIAAAGKEAADPTLSESERARAEALAARLDMPALVRAWQMLLKGLEETQGAPRPLAAAEMVLVRLAYVTDQPAPSDLLRQIEQQETGASRASSQPAGNGGAGQGARLQAAGSRSVSGAQAQPAEAAPPETALAAGPLPQPTSFQEVVALVEAEREVQLAHALNEQVRLVGFRAGHIELRLLADAAGSLPSELGTLLSRATGTRWMVSVSDEEGEKSLGEQRRDSAEAERLAREQEKQALAGHPALQEVFKHFPGAEIADVRPIGDED